MLARRGPISNVDCPKVCSANRRIASFERKAELKCANCSLALERTFRGDFGMFTLSDAANAAEVAKSTIWRAIKSGRLSASRSVVGSYHVDAAELFRVFPAVRKNDPTQQVATGTELVGTAAQEAQVAALKDVRGLLRDQIEDFAERSRRLERSGRIQPTPFDRRAQASGVSLAGEVERCKPPSEWIGFSHAARRLHSDLTHEFHRFQPACVRWKRCRLALARNAFPQSNTCSARARQQFFAPLGR